MVSGRARTTYRGPLTPGHGCWDQRFGMSQRGCSAPRKCHTQGYRAPGTRHHSLPQARWPRQSTAWLWLRPWPSSPGWPKSWAAPALTEHPHYKGLCVCGEPESSSKPPRPCSTGKAKARSIRPVSMQKWEHSFMQKGWREGVERGRRGNWARGCGSEKGVGDKGQ